MKISITFTDEVEQMPKTCHVCPFADLCDLRVTNLTGRDGVVWTKRAMTRRFSRCPMKVEEEKAD